MCHRNMINIRERCRAGSPPFYFIMQEKMVMQQYHIKEGEENEYSNWNHGIW